VRRGHPRIATPSIRFEALTAPLNRRVLLEFGRGEAAVIQLALEQRVTIVGIDEQKGRRAPRAAGLTVIGTLGLLAKAKVLGIVPSRCGINIGHRAVRTARLHPRIRCCGCPATTAIQDRRHHDLQRAGSRPPGRQRTARPVGRGGGLCTPRPKRP